MRKIYVVGNDTSYTNWMECEITKDMKEANLVVFTGGEDWTPSLYNEKQHPQTCNNLQRDLYELDHYEEAIQMGIPCIGICRGAQGLAMFNKARLVQHQSPQPYKHKMKTFDNKELIVTSRHHQAIYPFNIPKDNYVLLGWTKNLSKFHEDGNQQEMNPPVETEAIFFPKTQCLALQFHPEWQLEDEETIKWCRQLLNKLLTEQL